MNWHKGFRTEPPDDSLKPDYSERFKLAGYNRIQQQEAYDFYKQWTGPGFPRMIVIEIQHATPFYDDSYAVNSANIGPYGDAIMKELLGSSKHEYVLVADNRSLHPSIKTWEVKEEKSFLLAPCRRLIGWQVNCGAREPRW